jgi:hypothetical protein
VWVGLDIKKIKIARAFLIFLTVIVVIVSAVLASELNAKYYLLLFVALPLIYLSFKQYHKLNRAKLIADLREKWGVPESRSRNFSEFQAHFENTQSGDGDKYALDDRTWDDLDMNLVYAQIDRTLTIPGELTLYSLLRLPLFSEEELIKRDCIIDLFLKDRTIREKYQEALTELGKKEDVYHLDVLWEEHPPLKRYTFLFGFLLLLIPVFIVLGILNFDLAWFGLGITIAANMIIHYRTKEKIYQQLSSIRYLGKLIRCATEIKEIRHPVLGDYLKKIEQALADVSFVSRKTGFLGKEADTFFIFEYLNIIFLIEVRAFYSVLGALEKYKKQLKQIFSTIGFIDAMISVASFRAGLKNFVKPKFLDSVPSFDIKEAVHPLLKGPVPNSISVKSGGILITGSNMSGKTTFLKAVGVNAVLAQTIYTCLAREYRSGFFHIATLVGRKDNVVEGKSYYLDEINALLRIIQGLEKDVPSLCLLDEIFRGTNSLERISASAEVLLYLAKKNCCVFAATHDLELTELLVSSYKNYHFKEEVSEDDGISFDYKLLDGPSTTRNAIKLLRHAGYPDEIADAADSRVQKSIKETK